MNWTHYIFSAVGCREHKGPVLILLIVVCYMYC